MPKLKMFRSPADQAKKDLATDPAKLSQFNELWNSSMKGFAQQAILGNPWSASHASNATNYFDPLDTDIPADAAVRAISWNAMPGRIGYYNDTDWDPKLTQVQMYQLADSGRYFAGYHQSCESPFETFPGITTDPCSGAQVALPYGPYGPRGWQDEYTEWCVTRKGDDPTGPIIRIDFTCENPEYWYSLWRISPETVLAIYREIANPTAQMGDLTLKDPRSGQEVIDPSTRRPAYNPLNKWNSGPERTSLAGGAMHLTSTPNTLQTETGLAGGATIQRTRGNADPEKLLCCAQFGQPYRNSDPRIGQMTNQVVSAGFTATLADPPGLYIQKPDFSQYQLPSNAPPGATAADYWRVVRGKVTLDDQFGRPLPGNLILHAVFEVPASQGFTVSDIKINGEAILYAAQVAATFSVQLNAMAFKAPVPPAQPCVGDAATPVPRPYQMFFTNLWDAYYGTTVNNPMMFPMSLASNTVIVPPMLVQGQDPADLTLTCTGILLGSKGELPRLFSDDPAIEFIVLGLTNDVKYAVPGNSYPESVQTLALRALAGHDARLGLHGIQIANAGSSPGPMAPAFLNIQPRQGAHS